MELRDLGSDGQSALERVLGYLNFSSGAEDTQFLASVNTLYGILEQPDRSPAKPSSGADSHETDPQHATCYVLLKLLKTKLAELQAAQSSAFSDARQASLLLDLLSEDLIGAYTEFHRDLLFHHTTQTLFRPFLFGRMCETVLGLSDDWDDRDRCVSRMLQRINDYVGYRPVAVLENRTLEPYAHERVRPIPLYIREAGVGFGPYQSVVTQTLEMLSATDPRIQRAACFNPQQLAELAIDPRAYDFDHPVNKRPNYHFGQWDPHAIDNQGFYYRFVVQQVTLDALMQRLETSSDKIPLHQIETEAAAVLAGTILMAAGVSGAGPETFDSGVTLGNLLPGIAGYRDAFYEQLIMQLAQRDADHADRLRAESRRLRQPFGAARQHLNTQLTRKRASQLEHVRLASIYARMGQPRAAQRQIDTVPVASARMLCQIDCNLARSQRLIENGSLAEALELLQTCRDILNRAIECGAIIDPWNILGFDGNFSLFPAMENSIHDHRVDELLDIVDELFDTYGRLWSAAASVADSKVESAVSLELEEFAKWWHQYAVHEVSCVECEDALDTFRASRNVAEALKQWHAAGEATGDIGFWAPYVENFESPKAYAMVINMLLERKDVVAARGLLIHWLGQAEMVSLEHGDDSFFRLAIRWLVEVLKIELSPASTESPVKVNPCGATIEDWTRVQKFFDYLEANAGDYWSVPGFGAWEIFEDEELDESELDDSELEDLEDELEAEDDEDDDDLFGAAYEDVVYRDSTDDGIEGSVYDTASGQGDALDATHDAIVRRLAFLNALSRLRRTSAVAWMLGSSENRSEVNFGETLQSWLRHAQLIREDLERLVMDVWRHRLARPTHDYMSLAEFDRERMIKESLMEHIIAACVESSQSIHFIVCALNSEVGTTQHVSDVNSVLDGLDLSADDALSIRMIRCALQGKHVEARETWTELKVALRSEAVLYVPLVRGGNPSSIISVRIRQQLLRTLLSWLPRLGMLTETRELIDVIRQMERNVPAGPGAVTEFDDLYEVGFRALVDSIIRATNVDETQHLAPSSEDGTQLVSSLESMTESMLVTWLAHSRTLRLSVLEKVKGSTPWQELVDFIRAFGEDLFSQHFLSLANIRSILYQGVDSWLDQLEDNPPPDFEPRLLDAIGKQVAREDAIRYLSLTLEAIVENYAEYRDYNSTTTQSDRGDLLYNLLDFLRLLSNYERVVWNLKPVVVAHELLVRRGCNEAAQLWRRALSDRIAEEADRYEERLSKLQTRYAMQLHTVADRISERFLRPLIVDRTRALVEPSIRDPNSQAFEILEGELSLLAREPSGVGFEPPAWLLALEEEVHRCRRRDKTVDDQRLMEAILPAIDLTIEQVNAQIEDWRE